MNKTITKKLQKPHICVRIFGDQSVLVTDAHGNAIKPEKNPEPLVGAVNTYNQALWYKKNPTCVWFCGSLY